MKILTELENRFVYHPSRDGADAAKHARVREAFCDAANAIAREVPEGRERSVALTKIEESMFWANAGIARKRGAGSTGESSPQSGRAVSATAAEEKA